MNIEHELLRFISEEIGAARNVVVSEDEPLFSSGRVDSIGLLQVLDFIDRSFGVNLLMDGEPNQFDTIRGLADAVRERSRG
jgi:acyl carrier protein